MRYGLFAVARKNLGEILRHSATEVVEGHGFGGNPEPLEDRSEVF